MYIRTYEFTFGELEPVAPNKNPGYALDYYWDWSLVTIRW